ncbi:hypothetical protein D3C85_1711850 [compost metagenome]
MMIFSACDSGALPSRLAASRPCQTLSTMAGRQCRVREKRAPRKPGTDSLSSGWRMPSISPSGSIRKVRMIDGYRLL